MTIRKFAEFDKFKQVLNESQISALNVHMRDFSTNLDSLSMRPNKRIMAAAGGEGVVSATQTQKDKNTLSHTSTNVELLFTLWGGCYG